MQIIVIVIIIISNMTQHVFSLSNGVWFGTRKERVKVIYLLESCVT